VNAAEIQDLVRGFSDAELPAMWSASLAEMRTRELIRSHNNPVADYAEIFVARHVGGELAGKSMAGYDVRGPDGVRYQVKSRRITAENGSRQLGFIRNLDGDPFDVLVAVLFDLDLSVTEMWSIPVESVRKLARWVPHVNAHRIIADARVLATDPSISRLI
jgi:hypothetical protein